MSRQTWLALITRTLPLLSAATLKCDGEEDGSSIVVSVK